MLSMNRLIEALPELRQELDAADLAAVEPVLPLGLPAPRDVDRHAARVERSRKARERRSETKAIVARKVRKAKHEAALRREAIVAAKGAERVAAQAAKRVRGR